MIRINKDSKKTRNGRSHQTQDDGAGQGNEELFAKEPKTQVTRQAAKAQFLQPRCEAMDQLQRQKNNDQPANRGAALQGVGFVAHIKADSLPGLTLVEPDYLEKFTHFMLHDEFLRHHPGRQVCRFQLGEKTAVH